MSTLELYSGKAPQLDIPQAGYSLAMPAKVATVVGAGVQAKQHLRLLPLVREFDEIRVVSKYFEDAERIAWLHPAVRPMADIEAAVRTSDVVCLATHSYEHAIFLTRPCTRA